MQAKTTIELEILDLTEEGQGLGRYDNRVVFVSGALPKDVVRAQVTQTKKNYALAKTIKVITASEHRVDPPCPYAFACGGCSIQHMDYDAQLAVKSRFVYDALTRIGGQTDFELKPIVGMAFPYHYRNKAVYPFGLSSGKVVLGFYKPQSHDLVAIDACMIQHNDNAIIMKAVLKWANDHGISVYNEHSHSGILRHLMIRSTNRGDHMVGLIVNAEALPKAQTEALIKALGETALSIPSIMLNSQYKRGNTIMGDRFTLLHGQPTVVDNIGDLDFQLAMPAFFQVNPEQTTALYQKAIDYCQLEGHEVVWDIYSGAGTITLNLAKHAKVVYGNELVEAAVENARQNAKVNGIENAHFIAGPAEQVVPDWLKDHERPQVVVLDPPRKGAEPQVLEAILQMAPDRIVYVSCKPSTLARDVKILTAGGYKLVEATPVDMFPHTSHVETIILMTNSGSKAKK